MSFISAIRPQVIEDAQENASWYGECVSAPRFYAYVGNDPLNFTDPSGLCTSSLSGCASSAMSLLGTVARGIGDNGGPALEAGGVSVAGVAAGAVAGVLVPNTSIASSAQEAQIIQQATGNSGVQFAQQGISSTFRNGEFAGQSISDVSAGLQNGTISPDQLPLNVINRNGVTYTLNNRSLMALQQAGMNPTILNDVTGNPMFENQLTQRLNEIGSNAGPNFVPIIRGQ